jgi:hypothetical protein
LTGMDATVSVAALARTTCTHSVPGLYPEAVTEATSRPFAPGR